MDTMVERTHETSRVYCTLLAARGNVAKGWIRGRSRVIDNDGNITQRCALMAIQDAARGNSGLIQECLKRLVKAIGRLPLWGGGFPLSFIAISWNDEEGRTKEQVLEAFDLALAERGEWQ